MNIQQLLYMRHVPVTESSYFLLQLYFANAESNIFNSPREALV